MSVKQPLLLAVERDGPTRKERLNAVKSALMIETHKCAGVDWLAVHMPSARTFKYGVTATSDLFDCIAKVGRLMDESGVAQYGNTEREAVRKVVEHLGLPIIIE